MKTQDEALKEYMGRDYGKAEHMVIVAEYAFKAGHASRDMEVSELSDKLYHDSREASGIKYELGHEIEVYQRIQSEYEGKIQELSRQNEIMESALENIEIESHPSLKNKDTEFHNKQAREALEQVRGK